jgi:hypothetical protein
MIKTTSDLEIIKGWAEQFSARPQLIDDPKAKGNEVGIRLDLPGNEDDAFLPENEVRYITWEEFHQELNKQQLIFQYDPDKPMYRFIPKSSYNNPHIKEVEQHNDQIKADINEALKRD